MALLIRKTGEGVVKSLASSDQKDAALPSRKRRRTSSSMGPELPSTITQSAGFRSPVVAPIPADGPKADLSRLNPSIIKAVSKELKGTLVPTKQAVISLLQSLIQVLPGGLAQQFDRIVDPLTDCIKTASVASSGTASATGNTLRAAALNLVSNVTKTHSSSVISPHLNKLVPAVVAAAGDKQHKISSEAVATIEQLVQALTPPRSKAASQKSELQTLFDTIMSRINANDADVDVRQHAMQALAILLARTARGEGEALLSAEQRVQALNTLEERLNNETTRLAAARAITIVCPMLINTSYLNKDWIQRVCVELSGQLRKSDRALRGASLEALSALVVNSVESQQSTFESATISTVSTALYPLLTKDDLHLLTPALSVLRSLVVTDAKIVVNDNLIDAICEILSAPLVGSVLDALLKLVGAIGSTGLGQPLMTKMLRDVSMVADPAVTGKAIGTLLVSGHESVGIKAESFKTELDGSEDESKKILAITVLGEVCLLDSRQAGITCDDFARYFTSTYSKLPLAAAVAMGRAGAGNIETYLKYILDAMTQNSASGQYLLLHSVKEILQACEENYEDKVAPFAGGIWQQVMAASQNDDNKAVGAECIGRLTILDPQTFVPMLQVSLLLSRRERPD